jgi:Tol biopolymer transport system component
MLSSSMRRLNATSPAVLLAVIIASAAAGCGQKPATKQPAARDRIAIVAAERGPQGARLVAIDERGDRQFDLLEVPASLARDSHPALSPDGRWVVFASSRGRPLDETSLWIAPLGPSASPRRLTADSGIESHPTWLRDGSAIVFASTRAGGDFDLVSLRIADGQPAGDPIAITSSDGHEVTPAVARDGTVYYAAVTPTADGQVQSHLEARAADGTIRRVTDGPADTSPALSPDERTLLFARPVQHTTGIDAELWTMPREGAAASASVLVDVPLTDESGAAWSPDGRYVFATSVLRGAQGNAVFSSVIVIDTQARPLTARLLQDRTGAIARLTPAIANTPLDAAALAGDPEYLPELARIMAAAQQQSGEPSAP